MTALEISPERLRQHIWDLENLNCKVMVLCPTTEHALFQLAVHDVYTQLQAKPACTRKLQKALSELIAPRAVRADIGPPLSSHAPRVLCVDDNPANLLLV